MPAAHDHVPTSSETQSKTEPKDSLGTSFWADVRRLLIIMKLLLVWLLLGAEKVWRVRNVERFRPELKRGAFREPERPKDACVSID
jgi:hypothetical protein